MHEPNDTSRVILLGHLLITIPAIAAIPLVLYLGVYMFVPCLLLYCMCAGLAISWQWYSATIPLWKESLQ
jgi:hypothetical protein